MCEKCRQSEKVEYFVEVKFGVDWANIGPFNNQDTAEDVMKTCHGHEFVARVKVVRTRTSYV